MGVQPPLDRSPAEKSPDLAQPRHDYRPDAETVRQRIEPRPSDFAYLHTIDLLRGVRDAVSTARGAWLDFGCGGSPYRPLFTGVSRYLRADLEGEALDLTIRPPEPLDLPDGAMDGVLSTQVLEHVLDVAWYLGECRRVLAPGGRLVLTTHGTWVDHFWPQDFRRWTTNGLRAELETRGFAVERILQLTCDMRAVITLWETKGRVLRGSLLRLLLLGAWGSYKVLRPVLNPLLDRALAQDAIQNQQGDTEGALYINLLAEAVRT
ncbi:MAG TPA: class I SAM-dependent methyltransferase [Gemmatimonadales bacterium]|nr:class I SAM-dependent methyltransferase [Gemmatimonadales bacterium]